MTTDRPPTTPTDDDVTAARDLVHAYLRSGEGEATLVERVARMRAEVREPLRAALCGMVAEFGVFRYGPGGVITRSSDCEYPHRRIAIAAALSALGLPDPCPVEQLREA